MRKASSCSFTSRMAETASTASRTEPRVGTITKSARLIAYEMMRDAVPSRSTMTKATFSLLRRLCE